MTAPTLSVVVPIYNEEDVLPLFVHRLRAVLDELYAPYEVVAVDDGSSDATPVVLRRFMRDWPQLRIIRLRVNAGHQAAISAGLASCRGDFVVTIDADLQDPPESIKEMLETAYEHSVDVVYGVRSDRSSDSMFKRQSANTFYKVIKRMGGGREPGSAGDFRLMSRATVDAVNSLPEHHRVLRLVVPALGFPSQTVQYRREARAAGSSKYSLGRMLQLSLDSLTAFSTVPLRMATWFGLIGSVVAAGLLVFAVIARVVGTTTPGWTSIVAAVAGFGALQLLCLGLLGEYVGRTYLMMQGRPTYFIAYDSAVLEAPAAQAAPTFARRSG
ncbi:MAG: glycosyltransferase family 2 protein [Pseudonocardiales bacterium]|nr:glycosyltransferase family 2 protein [Actinomycetota bacterium]